MGESFQDWLKNGWVRPHPASEREIAGLLGVIDRDVAASADPKVDSDWRFAIAYNAALQCAALAMKASGFDVAKGSGAHHRLIESLRLSIGDDGTIVDTLQVFRAKRATSVYEFTNIASDAEIQELRKLAIMLRDRVKKWLQQAHPTFVPHPKSTKKSKDNRSD